MVKPGKTGLTLVEIIIVVIMLGILVTLGINYDGGVIKQQRYREAISNIKLLVAAETLYYQNNGVYAQCACTADTDCMCQTPCLYGIYRGCNFALNLSLNHSFWKYYVWPSGSTGWEAVACPQDGTSDWCWVTLGTSNEPICQPCH